MDTAGAVAQRRKAAKSNTKETTFSNKPWKARPVTVVLFKDENGQWWERINDGNPLPALDTQVSLWLALEDALREIERLRNELAETHV